MTLSSRDRIVLLVVAVLSFVGTNGVFLYFMIFRWNDLVAALLHPAAFVFVVDVFVVMILLAVFFARHPIGRHGWPTFVALSLLGGLGFSIPAFVLLNDARRESPG
jgi:hypothetical protein